MSAWNDDERRLRDLWAATPAPPSLRHRYESLRAAGSLQPPRHSLRPLVLAAALAVVIAAGGAAFGAHRLIGQGGAAKQQHHHPVPTLPPTAAVVPSPTPEVTATPSATATSGWTTAHRITSQPVTAVALDANAIYWLQWVPPIKAGFGSGNFEVNRSDRSTHNGEGTAILDQATSLVVAGNEVWVGTSQAAGSPLVGKILRFDAATLHLKGSITLPQGSGYAPSPYGNPEVHLSAAGNTVVAGFAGMFEVLDVATGTVRYSLNAGYQKPMTVDDVAISPDATRLYVVATSNDQVPSTVLTEWDPATRQPVPGQRTAIDLSVGPPKLTATNSGVWVTVSTGMMGQYSFRPGNALGTVSAKSDDRDPNSVHTAFADNILWVLSPQLRCADPRTGATHAADDNMQGYEGTVVADAAGTYVSGSDGIDLIVPPSACSG